MKRLLVAGALGVLMCVPSLALARPNGPVGPVRMVAPQYRIKSSYARRLVRAKLIKQTHHRRWSIKPATNLRNRPIGASMFYSAVPRGNPGLLSYDVTVNPVKGRGAPRGLKRVSLTPQGCLIGPNSPLTGALR